METNAAATYWALAEQFDKIHSLIDFPWRDNRKEFWVDCQAILDGVPPLLSWFEQQGIDLGITSDAEYLTHCREIVSAKERGVPFGKLWDEMEDGFWLYLRYARDLSRAEIRIVRRLFGIGT